MESSKMKDEPSKRKKNRTEDPIEEIFEKKRKKFSSEECSEDIIYSSQLPVDYERKKRSKKQKSKIKEERDESLTNERNDDHDERLEKRSKKKKKLQLDYLGGNSIDLVSENSSGYSLGHEITIDSETLSQQTVSSDNGLNIPKECSQTESRDSKQDNKCKSNKKGAIKKSNTLSSIIHQATSNSDSSDEEKQIKDDSKEVLNQRNRREFIESRISQIFMTTDEEAENEGSVTGLENRKKSDESPSRNGKQIEEGTTNVAQSPELRRSRKSEKVPTKLVSDSPKISTQCSEMNSKSSKEKKKSKTKKQKDKKKSVSLLTIIDASTSGSESENDRKKIRHENREIKVEPMNSSGDEGKENFISSSSKKQTLDMNVTKSKKNEKILKVGKMKLEKPDAESEPEQKIDKKKPKPEEKIDVLQSSIDNISGSDSDPDIGEKKVNDNCDETAKKETPPKRFKYKASKAFIYEDEEPKKRSDKKRKSRLADDLDDEERDSDLEVRARDVEEMIIALEEEEQVPRETMEKLRGLKVTLRHVVPPQHQIETYAGSRGPTTKQKQMFEKFGPIKYGKFSPEEDNLIVANWKMFCKMHNWDYRDVTPFLYLRHRDLGFVTSFTERQKFVQFLADGLPWRLLYSVYWRFRNIYQPHIVSRYSEEEDKMIIAYLEKSETSDGRNVRKFAQLAKLLKRTRASVWGRYRLLKQRRNPDAKIEWNLNSVNKLIKHLMRLTRSTDIKQLKDFNIPRIIWQEIAKRFQVNYCHLKHFWLAKLHQQLFCNEPIYLNDVHIKLIEYFYVKGISEWWEINWQEIVKHFDGMTSTFISQRFGRMIHNPRFENMELHEILEYLYEVRRPQLQQAPRDKCLPRLGYENGRVRPLDLIIKERSKEQRKKNSSDQVDGETAESVDVT